MAKRVGVDKWLFGVVLLLVLFGLVMVFSASAVMAQSSLGSPYPYVMKQAVWAVLGLLAMVALMQVDYRRYNNPKIVFPAVAITMLMLVGVFAMKDSHNTHRWVRFGDLFTFQPSEIAKPVLVLFLAYFLQTRMHAMDDWRTVLKAAGAPLLFTAMILYLAGAPFKYFFIGAAAASPVMYYMLFHVGFRRARMLAYLHPELQAK